MKFELEETLEISQQTTMKRWQYLAILIISIIVTAIIVCAVMVFAFQTCKCSSTIQSTLSATTTPKMLNTTGKSTTSAPSATTTSKMLYTTSTTGPTTTGSAEQSNPIPSKFQNWLFKYKWLICVEKKNKKVKFDCDIYTHT